MGVVADVAALVRALLERHFVGHALGAAERRRTRDSPATALAPSRRSWAPLIVSPADLLRPGGASTTG